ncbi:MAG: M23 family metallopeptidase [Gaiellaceae bacterium]
MAVPGKLTAFQSYNDTYRGWPVTPLRRQHPIRGSFLDPRPDPRRGAIYHEGVDVAVRDDRPERGAPRNRTHRVYAIEGGVVDEATAPGVRGHVRVGHFGYGHIDAVVRPGQRVRPGQMIGWTCTGGWHVHLTEFLFTGDGGHLIVNPLRRGGKLAPYVDTAPPQIHELRFHAPATPRWRRRGQISVAALPPAGRRLRKDRLSGVVDIRVRVSDPQSFTGWFRHHPQLAAPHHPFRLGLVVVSLRTRQPVLRRQVFWAEQLLGMPAGQHFAPGTEQNLPASGCQLFHRTIRCDGVYWFRLIPRPYWDTRRLPNGRYRLAVRAWDTAQNRAVLTTDVTIRN